MVNNGGAGRKLTLVEKLRQVGLPTNTKEIVGRVYEFFGKNNDAVAGIILGLHYTSTGDLFLLIHEGEIHMKSSEVGILKYGGKVDMEGRFNWASDSI